MSGQATRRRTPASVVGEARFPAGRTFRKWREKTCQGGTPELALEDKTIVCRDCGVEFIFTAGEQGFYLEKGLLNEPQRCPGCRTARRRERAAGNSREMTTVLCAMCGGEAVVPFVPRLDRPVYCSSCFEKVRSEVAS